VPHHPNADNQDQGQNDLDRHDGQQNPPVVCPAAPTNRTARRPPTLLRLPTRWVTGGVGDWCPGDVVYPRFTTKPRNGLREGAVRRLTDTLAHKSTLVPC
jgi:hypothetical protein